MKDKHQTAIRTDSLADYKNILIIKPSALGDIVLSMPAMNSLRKSFPSAKITWLVRKEFARIFDGSPRPDDIMLFDRKLLGAWWYKPRAFAAFRAFLKELRQKKFDLVIDLQGLFRTAFFSFITGSAVRLGPAGAREFAGLFYTESVKPSRRPIHLIDFYNEIVKAAGGTELVTAPGLEPLEKADTFVDNLLAENEVEPYRYAVFITGAARKYKKWPVDNFARLAERITSKFDIPILAVGTASEKVDVLSLAQESKVPVIDLVAKTDIQQLIALLRKAAVVITGDTGPGHIAWAVGTPAVFIFGPTNPSRVGPYDAPENIAAVDTFKRGRAIESQSPRHAVEKVTVDMVFDKAVFALKDKNALPE